MVSNTTKHYKRLAAFFTFLSLLLLVGPLSFYVIAGFAASAVVIEKVVLTCIIFIAVILTLICSINKWVFRSKIFLFILGLYLVIDKFILMIIIFAASQVIDELIVAPLARRFRNKASINAEIDKRGV